MLNGIDPIIIFNFKKNFLDPTSDGDKIPLGADEASSFPLPAIPIYLSEKLTGVYIDSEEKDMHIETVTTPTAAGDKENTNQRVLNSSVRVQMKGKQSSIGVALFTALTDLIIPKVTSKEYSITYIHGSVIIFNGLLNSFTISQVSGTDLLNLTMELGKPGGATKTRLLLPNVPNSPQAATLNSASTTVVAQ